MSRVRLCDSGISPKCPKIFAAGSEGSTEMSGSKNRRYKDGEQFMESVSKDFCPFCVDVMEGRALPVAATQPAATKAISGTIVE